MQLPPYIVFKPYSLEYLEWAQEQLGGDEMLVEFRHASWLDDENRRETLAFLESHHMTYVIVDAPRSGARNVSPTVVAAPTPTAYVRLHGRNAETRNNRTGSAAERFDYLYSDDELAEWVPPLHELAEGAEQAYAFFNNTSVTSGVAQAPAGAELLRRLLQESGVPTA